MQQLNVVALKGLNEGLLKLIRNAHECSELCIVAKREIIVIPIESGEKLEKHECSSCDSLMLISSLMVYRRSIPSYYQVVLP